MGMRVEVQLATTAIGYVGVELGRGEIGVPQQLLDAAQVRASLEQVRRERVPEQVRMDTIWLEACRRGKLAQDQERAGAGERAALGVQEHLRATAAVEVRPPAGE